jgi:hypothetical protein
LSRESFGIKRLKSAAFEGGYQIVGSYLAHASNARKASNADDTGAKH